MTNVELQNICTITQPAGTIYAHVGVLYNPPEFALAKDALPHDGPGSLSTIEVVSEYQKILADGLGVFDVLTTEGDIVVAAYKFTAYPNQTYTEPPIIAYAQKDIPT